MNRPPVVSAEEWQSARDALLVKEKALTRQLDALAAERRRLPMVRIDASYVFEGPDGKRTLLELFDGRDQLVIYHFMYGPDWDAPCPGCASYTDSVPEHLERLTDRGVTYLNVSRAPWEKIARLKEERRWTMPWFSSYGSTFNEDMGVLPGGGEMFALSAWQRDGDEVFRTYVTDRRGVDRVKFDANILDLLAWGRQEDWEDSPAGWPQHPTYG